MGQAFDRDGHVLGEAYGDTKREVFDKLIGQFKDAHEIRIRSLEHQVQPLTDADVDRFLANLTVTDPERVARIRARFEDRWRALEPPQSVAAVDPVGELAKRDPTTRA